MEIWVVNEMPPGVPGTLGTLTGKIPIPVQTTELVSYKAHVAVRWRLVDDQGAPVTGASWKIGAGGPGLESQGGSFAPSPDHALEVVSLSIDVTFVELTAGQLPVAKRT